MDELTIMDVNKKMHQSKKTMKYVDVNAFRELIKTEKFADAIDMIDNVKIPEVKVESTETSETTESKPKRKYTKKA